ncbi:MAG: heat-inducible transcriptional repressor HrcA [Alphaproteobacteria bacterium]
MAMKPIVVVKSSITELNERSRDIFRRIVDSYVETGEPVGSRTLARQLGVALSPATIRNVMADLEDLGLLYAPHTSAGRIPTELGLRLFVNGLLEVGGLSQDERKTIDSRCAAAGKSVAEVLEQATSKLSELSHCAGLVLAPKLERPLKHVEFVSLAPGRALVVLVTEGGLVENRIVEVPVDILPSSLTQATNYLNARIMGRTLDEMQARIQRELEENRAELDALTGAVVAAGLATWSGGDAGGALIVRGQANLLEDVKVVADLERIRALFETLETRGATMRLLETVEKADGVQIFIGSENEMFDLTGCSMVIAPYGSRNGKLIGAIGVIGPMRINYAHIIPLVDYTAKVIARLVG